MRKLIRPFVAIGALKALAVTGATRSPDVLAPLALHAKLKAEIENWSSFIDAKGIKVE